MSVENQVLEGCRKIKKLEKHEFEKNKKNLEALKIKTSRGVEHRGVEPLTSTMRMSRATAGPRLTPKRWNR